jgi:hypothetical protein
MAVIWGIKRRTGLRETRSVEVVLRREDGCPRTFTDLAEAQIVASRLTDASPASHYWAFPIDGYNAQRGRRPRVVHVLDRIGKFIADDGEVADKNLFAPR